MRQEKSCGCIIFNKNNEILLIRSVKGHWGMPKGHVEPGETEIETAIREVKEETNLDVEILDENKKYKEQYSIAEDATKEVVYFLAKNKNHQIIPQKEEIQDIGWFTIEDAIQTITYDNSRELIQQVQKELKEGKIIC